MSYTLYDRSEGDNANCLYLVTRWRGWPQGGFGVEWWFASDGWQVDVYVGPLWVGLNRIVYSA